MSFMFHRIFPAVDGKFRKDVSTCKAEKSAVSLPLSKPISYGLIARLVKYRVRENRESKKVQASPFLNFSSKEVLHDRAHRFIR